MPETTATTGTTAARTFGRSMLEHWHLDPASTYLNHGTVGACPRVVLAAMHALDIEIERQPARFMIREVADVKQFEMRMPARVRTAMTTVAAFVRAGAEDMAFVDNATTGCNAVLRSYDFKPGDEILVTNQGYGAITKTAEYVASRTGAKVATVKLPFPGTTPQAVVAAITAALTPKSRMLVVDHVVASSALILPVAEIAKACRARGVATLIDGAHAPGMLDLDLPALGVDFYVGNLHKWAMSPRSCAILWSAPERQAGLKPAVISWGYQLGMSAEFDLPGTRDPGPWLAAPAGIAFMQDLGLDAMRRYNHELVWRAAKSFTERWGTSIPAPESMYGSMVSIPLPERFGTEPKAATRLKDALLYDHAIEAQLAAFEGRIYIRLAAQVYNDDADFERLFTTLEQLG